MNMQELQVILIPLYFVLDLLPDSIWPFINENFQLTDMLPIWFIRDVLLYPVVVLSDSEWFEIASGHHNIPPQLLIDVGLLNPQESAYFLEPFSQSSSPTPLDLTVSRPLAVVSPPPLDLSVPQIAYYPSPPAFNEPSVSKSPSPHETNVPPPRYSPVSSDSHVSSTSPIVITLDSKSNSPLLPEINTPSPPKSNSPLLPEINTPSPPKLTEIPPKPKTPSPPKITEIPPEPNTPSPPKITEIPPELTAPSTSKITEIPPELTAPSTSKIDIPKKHVTIKDPRKPFQCNMCPKAYTRQSSLYNHKRIHFSKKQYICDKCDKKFILPGSLINHKKNIHDQNST